jgi:Ca2+-binding EF-hand superfamily protein
MADTSAGTVGEILTNIQAFVYPRRMRAREPFVDFDPLRSGRCTKAHFARAIDLMGLHLTEPEVVALSEYFEETGPHVQEPQVVNYLKFCQIVEEGYGGSDTLPPGSPYGASLVKPEQMEWSHDRLSAVDKLRSKVVEKRVRVYEQFHDFDRLRKGTCSVGQVNTVFTILNLGKEIGRADFDEIIKQYASEDGRFCYMDFCRDVDKDFTYPVLEKEPLKRITMPDASTTAPARRNKITLSAATQEQVAALEEKMRYRIRTRGMLLKPTFQDMDKCNRGYVTKGQFSRVLDMLGFGLDEASIKLLRSVYCNLGNLNDVNYIDFLKSVDSCSEEQDSPRDELQSPRSETSKYFDARGRVSHLVSAMA